MSGWICRVASQHLLRVVLLHGRKKCPDQTLEIALFVFGARKVPMFQWVVSDSALNSECHIEFGSHLVVFLVLAWRLFDNP